MAKVDHLEISPSSVRIEKILSGDKKKLTQWAFVALALILTCAYLFFTKEESKNQALVLESSYFALTRSSQEELPHTLKNFEDALIANPDLAPNFQGKAAQHLLENSSAAEAELLLNPLFARTHLEDFPGYQAFSEITVMIAGGDLTGALAKSKTLQEEATGILSAHNLIRTAFLQKLLNDEGFSVTVQKIQEGLTNTSLESSTQADLKKAAKIYNYKTLGLTQYFDSQL